MKKIDQRFCFWRDRLSCYGNGTLGVRLFRVSGMLDTLEPFLGVPPDPPSAPSEPTATSLVDISFYLRVLQYLAKSTPDLACS